MPVGPSGVNIQIYDLIFEIETALRELLIETMTTVAGPKWYRSRLPHEALDHFHLGIASDRETRWTRNIPHHPVYYLTFPDLRLTIEQRDNWNDAFRSIFPRTKELVTTDLLELEFIRNKVAHNRRASAEDLRIVEAAHSKLWSTLTPPRANALAASYSTAPNIATSLTALEREASITFALAASGKRIKFLPQWEKIITESWWFDEAYLGGSVRGIERVFGLLKANEKGMMSPNETASLKVEFQVARSEFKNALRNWPAATFDHA